MNFYIWACALLQKNIEKLLNKLAKSREKNTGCDIPKKNGTNIFKKIWRHSRYMRTYHLRFVSYNWYTCIDFWTYHYELNHNDDNDGYSDYDSMRTYQLRFVAYNWSVGPIDRHSRYMLQCFLLLKTQVC